MGLNLLKTIILALVLLSGATNLQVNSTVRNGSVSLGTTLASTLILVPENYSSIQEAVNAANPGDTVFVQNGTYYESIYINKTVTLVGIDPDRTVIDGSRSNATYDPVIWISGESAGNVVLRNFTVKGSRNSWGIYILGASNITVENNVITNNHGGIVADESDSNAIVNNTIEDNVYEGLLLLESSGNTVKNNTLDRNTYNFGIQDSAFDNDIDESNLINGEPIYYLQNHADITINPTTYQKIGYLALINCSDMTVENLNLSNNYNGILIAQTDDTNLTNNTFTDNCVGVEADDSAGNTFQANNIANNFQGIALTNSSYNTYKQNNLTANTQHINIIGARLSDFLQDIDTTNTVDTKLVHYLTNQTNLVINPFTFPNIGYLALVNCQNITVQTLSIQNNTMLVAFSQNSAITQNKITNGGVSLQSASHLNVSSNTLSGGDSAIAISNSHNNTVGMNNITQNHDYGVSLESSIGNAIVGNNIAENNVGVSLQDSTGNTIVGNNITTNKDYGIILTNSNRNTIRHNNFISNAVPGWQAVCSAWPGFADDSFDNGYPSGGNFWSDYNGTDQHSGNRQNENGPDAIGDTAYNISFEQQDHYPLISPYHDFTETRNGQAYDVEIISNSSIANLTLAVWLSSPKPPLQPGQQFLMFFVSGQTDTTGFCRVTIPRDLLNGTYTVLVDWNQVPVTEIAEPNSSHAYLYFTYVQSEHTIAVVPEYANASMIIMITVSITITATMARKKRKNAARGPQESE